MCDVRPASLGTLLVKTAAQKRLISKLLTVDILILSILND